MAKKLFDFCIGNPPYQDETIGENDTYAPPVYHKFLDEAFKVGESVEMIHPARFLFDAGSTPKSWNRKMLDDEHFKVLHYEADCSKIFSNTEIKGGLAISYHDSKKNFGAIDVFTPYEDLNDILQKIKHFKDFKSFSNIVVTSYAYHFTDKLYEDYPHARGALSSGHEYDLKSNVFSKMPQPFHDTEPTDGHDYIRILGRENNERIYKYIRADYVNTPINLHSYKVFLSGATGSGKYGETLVASILGKPGDGSTETFLSMGTFDSAQEADNVSKYIKTKFARALLGILKRTQANTPGKWKFVPLQDFSASSDIDWSSSVAAIDQQLYRKYGLSKEEIDFIEDNVKEMQ